MGKLITALRAKRSRPYLHTVIFVLLVSWIALSISATCVMPMPSVIPAMSEHMPGCLESGAPEHSSNTMQNCAFKPCLDSQNDASSHLNRLTKPDMPVFMLSLIGTFLFLFRSFLPTKVPHAASPPSGRRILLIYWFCTLLN